MRIARELELYSLSACVRRAPCGSAVNPERASDFDVGTFAMHPVMRLRPRDSIFLKISRT